MLKKGFLSHHYQRRGTEPFESMIQVASFTSFAAEIPL
jgi:hypothetical protein